MTKETTLSKDYNSIVEKDSKYVMQTYTRQPLALESGQGSIVRDIEGREFIDCVAGIAVNNVGHCHPKIVEALSKQAGKLIHTSNLYYTDVQANFAEELVNISGMGRAFFCNSGTEAVEAAMKLARVATGKKEFIATENSFHGRTMGSLTVTYKSTYRKPFEPLIQGERFVPYNSAQAIRDTVTEDTAAVIVEPIQGEGGINVPSDEYLREVREICDENEMLLIFDEVQTGFGRTGKWFCKDHSKVKPDIMTMAKAIGGGFPMGAIVARDGISFEKSQHAATFGGGPLACAAALASINVIRDEKLVERSAEMGQYFMNELNSLDNDSIVEVRGRGLMIGVEINRACADIVDLARDNGILLNCTSEKVIRIAPPLIITKEQIDKVVEIIGQI
ncbi:acetylornithine transaminase [Methanococcoides burtonii]|uniref:Acetylornithine aminotransferase n=1 Tax=Methanococcoides burtonii (strain DSM 6242 / NBRC 107633 / OCM 468 / ACE-M) TaxID=259564 RepID=Q12U07_METBU|nr:acetylornithine transaminase [Methanococcoides burtonii]ABE53069.1 Acetylornithine/acetyl-lysine aminotransferase [Methanococcoides burtonii DSM 6242]